MPLSIKFDKRACMDGLMEAYMQAVEELIQQAEREASARAPSETGNLRATIESAVTHIGNRLIRGVVSAGGLNAFYAAYTERGTGIYADSSIRPRPRLNPRRHGYPSRIVPWGKGNQWTDVAGRTHPGADWLVFESQGKKWFLKSVKGYPGFHWLENTFKWLVPSCQERFIGVLESFDFSKYLICGGGGGSAT